jgi:hypothetical protein
LTGSPHGLFVIRSKQKVRSERTKAVSIATTDEPMTSGEGPSWIPSPLYRLTLEQYEAMVDSGVFSGRDRLHLIGGYLVAKMTQNDLHATADELCGEALGRTIPDYWHVRAAKPIRIASQASKPEPDRCIARGNIRDYLHRSPESADIALVVEISDTRCLFRNWPPTSNWSGQSGQEGVLYRHAV